jgi:hypothetical protein
MANWTKSLSVIICSDQDASIGINTHSTTTMPILNLYNDLVSQ